MKIIISYYLVEWGLVLECDHLWPWNRVHQLCIVLEFLVRQELKKKTFIFTIRTKKIEWSSIFRSLQFFIPVYVYSPCWTKTPCGCSSEKSFKKPCSDASILFPVLYLKIANFLLSNTSNEKMIKLTMFCSCHHHPVLCCIPKLESMWS